MALRSCLWLGYLELLSTVVKRTDLLRRFGGNIFKHVASSDPGGFHYKDSRRGLYYKSGGITSA